MKTLFRLLGLILIDFALIWYWVYRIPPDPSISIAILFLVSLMFLSNVLISGIFFWFKWREYARLFLWNSILSSVMMYIMFHEGIKRYQSERLESWKFNIADTTFSLIRWKKENEFSMSYSLEPGSSWGFLDGGCEMRGNDWVLKADSTQMMIHDDYLIGFRTKSDTIKMMKDER